MGSEIFLKPEGGTLDQSPQLRFLAYALPGEQGNTATRIVSGDGFQLHDVPLRSSESFLDYDGTVIWAGAFEKLQEEPFSFYRQMVCISRADLDRRYREFCSAIKDNKMVIFLVSHLPTAVGHEPVDPACDLFRRITTDFGISWGCLDTVFPAVESTVSEFQEFVTRYGTGYVVFGIQDEQRQWAKPICIGNGKVYGIVLGANAFFLPSPVTQTHEQAVEIAKAAVTAVIAYRRRISTEMPEWTDEFVFSQESALREQEHQLRTKLAQLEAQINSYVFFKGALAYQSEPLVEVVKKLLSHFFDISLTVDERCIEDATLQDSKGHIEAVFEIKGVKRNFKRKDVNQVDSHRERLGLAPTIPGVLIMNTLMGAGSLQAKDQPPHSDIIKKAVADHVLLIRTLDLLRYADAVEKNVLSKDEFKKIILNQAGWLKVENEQVQVVKE